MVELLYNDKSYEIPAEYNDLTGDQLIKLAPLLKSNEPDALLLSLRVLQVLMNKSTAAFYFLSLDLRERALEYVQWVFEKNTLTKQILPSIDGYYGPKSNFDNLTLEEYHCAEIFYSDFLSTADTESLNKLVAVLYRKPKSNYDDQKDPDGDIRMPFNEHEIDFWAGKISKWPSDTKEAVLLWYDGCRQYLIALYATVFAPQAPSSETQDNRGMFGVMRQIADGSKYGQFEQVKKLNIHTALLEMEELIKEAAAAENLNA
jgi:hypothetical protein